MDNKLVPNCKTVAFCGACCSDCPTFIATQKNTDEARREAAEELTKQFGLSLAPEDINCDGCVSDSDRLFSVCTMCEVRKCGKSKKVKNCAYCRDYACQKLKDLLEMMPPYTKANLEAIRKSL